MQHQQSQVADGKVRTAPTWLAQFLHKYTAKTVPAPEEHSYPRQIYILHPHGV